MFCLNSDQEMESAVTHIYAFGSICRGDISIDSDIDLLALVTGYDSRLSSEKFSIYSYTRISELWNSGNAFAWHLALESKLVYSEDGNDFIAELGLPSSYTRAADDCRRFRCIFESAFFAVRENTPSLVFELSTIFLAIRNIATCFSLAMLSTPEFGRNSARKLGPRSISISDTVYSILMRARLLSTRGLGNDIVNIDKHKLMEDLESFQKWFDELCAEVENNA